MREGRLDIKFIYIYIINPSDGGALLMIRVLYVGIGLPRISMDQGGFQCGIGGVAVHDKGGLRIAGSCQEGRIKLLLHSRSLDNGVAPECNHTEQICNKVYPPKYSGKYIS